MWSAGIRRIEITQLKIEIELNGENEREYQTIQVREENNEQTVVNKVGIV